MRQMVFLFGCMRHVGVDYLHCVMIQSDDSLTGFCTLRGRGISGIVVVYVGTNVLNYHRPTMIACNGTSLERHSQKRVHLGDLTINLLTRVYEET